MINVVRCLELPRCFNTFGWVVRETSDPQKPLPFIPEGSVLEQLEEEKIWEAVKLGFTW